MSVGVICRLPNSNVTLFLDVMESASSAIGDKLAGSLLITGDQNVDQSSGYTFLLKSYNFENLVSYKNYH